MREQPTFLGGEVRRRQDPRMLAQRSRLSGIVCLETGRLEEAECHLQDAHDRYRQLGLDLETLRVLMDQAKLYTVRKQTRSLANLAQTLSRLIQDKKVQSFLMVELKKFRNFAERKGIPMETVSELVLELEKVRGPIQVN